MIELSRSMALELATDHPRQRGLSRIHHDADAGSRVHARNAEGLRKQTAVEQAGQARGCGGAVCLPRLPMMRDSSRDNILSSTAARSRAVWPARHNSWRVIMAKVGAVAMGASRTKSWRRLRRRTRRAPQRHGETRRPHG
ncbi:MAG: hypothetical protein MZV64_33515 [Ignavibacteriales bacterium]|nr:hypothetical protein [Ignavibacteriales bacterium]